MAEATLKNQAFLFIKPHACTPKAQELVEKELKAKGFTVLSQGEISAADIDKKQLIDEHYYAIASKATILKPNQLNVPADKFKAKFGVEWSDVLAQGLAYNAMDGAAKLGLDATQLEEEWRKAKKERDACIKFGGGFYCSQISGIYIFNGFFMSMRAKYVEAGKKIIYYSISWDESSMSWEDFRSKALGPTNPAEAPKDSIRGMIYANWSALGLEKQPDTGDNGVHASASPFEGLSERCNWLGASLADDPYGKAMIAAGIPADMITAWSKDPQVKLDVNETMGSLFDALEDMNATPCLKKATELCELNTEGLLSNCTIL